ncbi:Peptidase S10, serine carboxypeptidase [Corchorus olitorius]|uniref:Carboxypeptidase n=1 Tax=Corchorus olitorius TaxID=93759 RepID=A0A1R3IIM8_9ROSI|nr:Peptidase S10, serine carboxypeptidase [Corchorus olitorius]
MGSYTDPGDLISPICLSPNSLVQTIYQGALNLLHDKLAMKSAAVANDPCLGDRIHQYLNTPKVQRALHANTTHLPSVWEFCGGHLAYQRENIGIDVIPLLSKLLRRRLPILLFNGDQDSKIPLTQTRIIANMLAKELKLVPLGNYAPWYDKMQVSAELITRLPGQPANVGFKQYSGYIVTDSKHGRALFYYFVEIDAAEPLLHPLTLWFNGGPGCSSLGYGAFKEHGPFQPGEDGNLVKNQYSWNLAKDNLQFLVNWFKEFPQYRNSDLYLTGESYAGHYVPQLAALLLDYNKHSNGKPIKLKAIALGNPLLDLVISIDSTEFLWSHGLISDELLMLTKTVCNRPRYLNESLNGNLSKECIGVFNKQYEEIGSYTDFGDLILPLCTSTSLLGQSLYLGKFDALYAELAARSVVPGDPCLDDRIYQYLNKPKVQQALHANTTHLPYTWDFCSRTNLAYQRQNLGINIIPLVLNLLKSGVPILLYNGDQDAKIPLTQTRIIANMIAKEMKYVSFGSYAPWFDNMQVGGWTQSFGKAGKGKNVTFLTFATVRGAAHEVPYTTPSPSLTLFRAFIKGSPLPRTIKQHG